MQAGNASGDSLRGAELAGPADPTIAAFAAMVSCDRSRVGR
jgi:hypothetical protein